MNNLPKPYSGKNTIATVFCVCLLLVCLASAKKLEVLSNELTLRSIGVGIGVVLILTGNILPKFVLPLAVRKGGPKWMTELERFAGWAFFITGFVFGLAWLIVPLPYAKVVSSTLGLLGCLVVCGVWLWRTWPRPFGLGRPEVESLSQKTYQQAAEGRRTIICLIHAVVWVFIILLMDAIWGDHAAQWTAVLFVLANGILLNRGVSSSRANTAAQEDETCADPT